MALAIDALRLIRLMDTAPGWWGWSTHQMATTACWTVFEEIFASGASLSPMILAELRSLIDEQHETRFAAVAMPRELLQEAKMMDEFVSGEGGARLRLWIALSRISLGGARSQANMMNEAVALHRYLQEIENGRWPALEQKTGEPHPALFSLAQLADQLARMRQAKTAILLAEARLRGVTAPSLETLGIPSAALMHPLTRETIRLTRRGSMDVLAFATSMSRVLGETNGLASDELVWRLATK
jgi:hypothetical protein